MYFLPQVLFVYESLYYIHKSWWNIIYDVYGSHTVTVYDSRPCGQLEKLSLYFKYDEEMVALNVIN